MSDKSQVKLYLPEELHDLLNTDKRSNSDAAEAALWREFGGQKRSGIQQRIREKEKRITVIENEIAKREDELEEEKRELETLKAKLEEKSSKAEQVRDAIEGLPEDRIHPDNEAVKVQADKVDMDPVDLLHELGYEVDE